jgi:hypothetical protein
VGVVAGNLGLRNTDAIVKLPLSENTHVANDSSQPLCLTRPNTPSDATELAAFRQLANVVSTRLLQVQYGDAADTHVCVQFDSTPDPFRVDNLHLQVSPAAQSKDGVTSLIVRLFSDTGAIQMDLSGKRLRATDPKTGDSLQPTSADSNQQETTQATAATGKAPVKVTKSSTRNKTNPSSIPVKVQKKGRYGFSVEWADGATIIYSNLALARAVGGVQTHV